MPSLMVASALVSVGHFDRTTFRHAGAVYDAAGQLVPVSQRSPTPTWKAADAERYSGPKPQVRIREAIYLGHFFAQFGHFLIETLANLIHARSFRDDLPLLFHAWHNELGDRAWRDFAHVAGLIEAAGISSDRIYIVDYIVDRALSVERLHIPPRVFILGRGVQSDFRPIMDKVRAYALARCPNSARVKRVYLSRRGVFNPLRETTNEEAVEEEFRRRDFFIVRPETLPIIQQVALAAKADTLAGLDGSALHLSMFHKLGLHEVIVRTRETKIVLHINEAFGVITHIIRAASTDTVDGRIITEIDIARLRHGLDQLPLPDGS